MAQQVNLLYLSLRGLLEMFIQPEFTSEHSQQQKLHKILNRKEQNTEFKMYCLSCNQECEEKFCFTACQEEFDELNSSVDQ